MEQIRYYICPSCGDLTTSKSIDEDIEIGGMGLCGCQYCEIRWNYEEHYFEPIYFKCYPEWIEISLYIYMWLETEPNTVLRLNMFHSIPVVDRNRSTDRRMIYQKE